jgi:hypothetical protein
MNRNRANSQIRVDISRLSEGSKTLIRAAFKKGPGDRRGVTLDAAAARIMLSDGTKADRESALVALNEAAS